MEVTLQHPSIVVQPSFSCPEIDWDLLPSSPSIADYKVSLDDLKVAYCLPLEVRLNYAHRYLHGTSCLNVPFVGASEGNHKVSVMGMSQVARCLTVGFGLSVRQAWPLMVAWNENRTGGRPWFLEDLASSMFWSVKNDLTSGFYSHYFSVADAAKKEQDDLISRRPNKTNSVCDFIVAALTEGPKPRSYFSKFPNSTFEKAVKCLRDEQGKDFIVCKQEGGGPFLWSLTRPLVRRKVAFQEKGLYGSLQRKKAKIGEDILPTGSNLPRSSSPTGSQI